MKPVLYGSLWLAAGIVAGAAAVETIHAQAGAPVYQISLQNVTNQDVFSKEFVPAARASIKQYGGQVLAGSKPIAIEGAPSVTRVVVNRWDSLDQLKKWHASPEYKKARQIGDKAGKYQIFAVEGVAAQ
jgi:uncharacterized protein (DUF1330 family)